MCGSYHAFVDRDVEAGRTCPRAKAGPVKAPAPTIPAASATPVKTHGFTIVSVERCLCVTWRSEKVHKALSAFIVGCFCHFFFFFYLKGSIWILAEKRCAFWTEAGTFRTKIGTRGTFCPSRSTEVANTPEARRRCNVNALPRPRARYPCIRDQFLSVLGLVYLRHCVIFFTPSVRVCPDR